MTDGGHGAPRGAATRNDGAVRTRLRESALRLFVRHGVSGTSLQMIADDLGVTKAAVYHHCRTKDEIVAGVIAATVQDLRRLTDEALREQDQQLRSERTLEALVDLVLTIRGEYTVLVDDPSIVRMRDTSPAIADATRTLFDVFAGPDPSDERRVAVALLLKGVVGPLTDPGCAGIPDDDLRRSLVVTGRRLLSSHR